jgi:hypothetical protein
MTYPQFRDYLISITNVIEIGVNHDGDYYADLSGGLRAIYNVTTQVWSVRNNVYMAHAGTFLDALALLKKNVSDRI